MNELKQEFTRAARHEPPLHTSRQVILSAGRSRQRRHAVLSTVSGAGVAALAVAAVLTLSPRTVAPGNVAPGNVAPGAGGSLDVSTASVESATPVPSEVVATATPVGPTPSGTSGTSGNDSGAPPSLSPHAVEVTANHKAKFSAIVTALTSRLTGRGYRIASMDSVDNELAMSPTGIYDVHMEVTKDGQRGRILVSSQSAAGAEARPTTCPSDMYACAIVATVGGGTAMFNSDNKESAGAYGRHVAVWWSGVITQAQYLNMPADLSLKLSDDLLISLATDPALDLSDVMTFTPAEVAAFNPPPPGTKAANPSPTTAEPPR